MFAVLTLSSPVGRFFLAAPPCKDNKGQMSYVNVYFHMRENAVNCTVTIQNHHFVSFFKYEVMFFSHYVCFYFMQIVLQETRPKSPGRGQSKGSHRGRLQKTRAHKVRTHVWTHVSNLMQYRENEYICITEPFTDFYFLYMLNFSFAEGAISFFLYFLSFSCSQEIPNLSLDGLSFLKKGKKGTHDDHKGVCLL